MEDFNQQMELVAGNQQTTAHGWAEREHGQTVARRIRVPWSAEEDAAFIELVKVHGPGNWATIAKGLPGRTRKQCLERWNNKLRPGLQQRDLWTEEEDKSLIEAHKVHGNSWSTIASCLGGRSQISVKNHWNATIRSLGVKRWVKKKKSRQVPYGHVTILEEYILGLHQTAKESDLLAIPSHDEVEAFTSTVNMPGAEMMDGEPVHPHILTPSASYSPPEMEMDTNSTRLTTMPEMQGYNNYNEPQVTGNLHSFIDYVNRPVQQDMISEDPQGTNINMNYPLSENVEWQPSSQGSSNALSNEEEGSIIGHYAALDDIDVLEMASMNMFSPEYDVNIDPTNYI